MLGYFTKNKKRSFLERAETVALFFTFNMVWCAAIFCVLGFIDGSVAKLPGSIFGRLFYACLFAPLWEELAFRYVPITLARRAGAAYVLPVVVISSILFGVLHGGYLNILVQGVAGFTLSLVYIRNGFSYWSSVSAHALWNFMLAVGLPSLMK